MWVGRFKKGSINSIINLSILGPSVEGRTERLVAVLDEVTNGYGNLLYNTWQYSEEPISKIMDNLDMVFALEREERGSVKYLLENYGIRVFARYPKDMLLEQYQSREEKGVPYGLLIDSVTDPSGLAYISAPPYLSQPDTIAHAYKEAKTKGTCLKVCQVIHSDDFVDRVTRNAQTHGLLSYLLLNSYEVGNVFAPKDQPLHQTTLDNLSPHLFLPNARILLIGFSRYPNFAPQLSQLLPQIEIHTSRYSTNKDILCIPRKNGLVIEEENGMISARILFTSPDINAPLGDWQQSISEPFSGSRRDLPDLGRTYQVTMDDLPTDVYLNGKIDREYSH